MKEIILCFFLDWLSMCNPVCFGCPCPSCPSACGGVPDNSNPGPNSSMLRPIQRQANNGAFGFWQSNQQGAGYAYGQGYGRK